MEILLSDTSENIVAEQLEFGGFNSPEEVVDKALESLSRAGLRIGSKEKDAEEIKKTIHKVEAFGKGHQLSPGISLRDMVELGRRQWNLFSMLQLLSRGHFPIRLFRLIENS